MTRAWHFVGPKLRNGEPVPADGVKLVWPGKLAMCELGLHASLHPFDALQYAPGSTLCLVECGGEMLHQEDKLVCRERTIIARMNAEPLLCYFARMQALSVAHLWTPPDLVCNYLMTGDESIRAAARGAARAAARDAAWDDARDAARAAAWDAARDAAWDAARTAAGAAAGAAAGGDARDAAWAAAWDAAWDDARSDFATLVNEAFEAF